MKSDEYFCEPQLNSQEENKKMITKEQLKQIMPKATDANIDKYIQQ